jgi:hypothetical protein
MHNIFEWLISKINNGCLVQLCEKGNMQFIINLNYGHFNSLLEYTIWSITPVLTGNEMKQAGTCIGWKVRVDC